MLLRVENVSKSFGGLRVLKQVSLHIADGEILGLIGPNGAGKTTLLDVIAGVHRPDAGALYLNGENVIGLDPHVLCKRGLARTFQIAQPFPRFTALENVLVAATFGSPRGQKLEAERRSRELLEFVEFPLAFESVAANLNTAQLKRLDLARALASQPRLLLLDEIAAGLTPTELRDLIRLLRRIREGGISLLVVEHLMRVIMQVCDRVAFLQSGEKVAEGSPEQIAQDARVASAYLGDDDYGHG